MDVRSLAVGLVTALLVGLAAQYVPLGPVATAAILALLPVGNAELLGAAMLGYTVARHA